MSRASALPTAKLPPEIYALFVVRLVVSAGSFVGPFLTMILTIKLGYADGAAGAFVSGVTVAGAVGLFAGGHLGDRLERAGVLRWLQAATAGIFLVCALVGFTPVTPFLMAAALVTLQGTWPLINALVADRAPPERTKEAFALIYWGNNIGFSIGPLIAGLLFDAAPRALFVGNAVALFIAAGVVGLFVRRPGAAPGGAQAAVAERAAEATIVARPLSRKSALVDALRRHPILVLYGLSSVLGSFIYAQHSFALPVYLKDGLGPELGPKLFGSAMTTNGLTVVLLTSLVTLLSRRLPSLAAVSLSYLFYAAGFGGYALSLSALPILGMTAFWTVGEILGATNGNAFIAERSPPEFRARINSFISVCHVAGGAMGPLVAGAVSDARGSAAVWPFVAVLSLLSAGFSLFIYRGDTIRSSAKR